MLRTASTGDVGPLPSAPPALAPDPLDDDEDLADLLENSPVRCVALRGVVLVVGRGFRGEMGVGGWVTALRA
jgi:hypothetical protein